MERAIDQFRNMPSTWLEINQFSDLLKREMLSGEVNPLEVQLLFKAMTETIEKTLKDKYVKQAVLDEADKYPEKTFDYKGITVTKSSKTVYDYSECGDQVYNDMVAEMEKLKERIKAREAMIKTGVNTDTGETYNPPKSSTTQFLTVKFKQE